MTVLEKIKRCVSLVWDFQEFYGDEDIEDFCSNELDKYSQYNEILDYFKRITELEQKNKVLAQNLEDTEIVNKALEKENAELKHTIATLRQEKDNVSMHAKAMEVVAKTRSDQLTKAKELLKKWLQTSNASDCDNINIVTDTEQFIKDSEVEK